MRNLLYILIVLVVIGMMLVSGVFVLAGLMNLFTYGVNWPLWLLSIAVLFASSYALEVLIGD